MARLSLGSHLAILDHCPVGREGYFYFRVSSDYMYKHALLLQLLGRKKGVTSAGCIAKEQCKKPRHWSLALPSPQGKHSLWRTALQLDIIWLGGGSAYGTGTALQCSGCCFVCALSTDPSPGGDWWCFPCLRNLKQLVYGCKSAY